MFQNNELLFFFSVFGKLNAHREFFRKSSCMTKTEASVPVQSFNLSSATKLLSDCWGLLYLSFVLKQPASLAYSNRDRTQTS